MAFLLAKKACRGLMDVCATGDVSALQAKLAVGIGLLRAAVLCDWSLSALNPLISWVMSWLVLPMETMKVRLLSEGSSAVTANCSCSCSSASHLYPDADWVLSGINAGGNLGADTYVSGTVAAVREATLMRKRAIAISQYRYRSEPYDWDRAARLTVQVLKRLMVEDINPGEFWNVNLPAPPPARTDGEAKHQTKDNPQIIFCGQCTQPLPTEFAIDETGFRYVGAYEERPRDVGADVDVCFGGNISVVKVRLW